MRCLVGPLIIALKIKKKITIKIALAPADNKKLVIASLLSFISFSNP